MKTIISVLFYSILLIGINSCQNYTYSSISGRITIANTDSGITNVLITTDPPSVSVLSDKKGHFRIDSVLRDTVYIVHAIRDGFVDEKVSVNVMKGFNVSADIPLKRSENVRTNLPKSDINITGKWEGEATFIRYPYQHLRFSLTINGYSSKYSELQGEGSFFSYQEGEKRLFIAFNLSDFKFYQERYYLQFDLKYEKIVENFTGSTISEFELKKAGCTFKGSFTEDLSTIFGLSEWTNGHTAYFIFKRN